MFEKITSHSKIEAIEILRFPLIILIVFVHLIPSEIYSVQLSLDGHDIYTLFSELISHNIGRIAVPCFFLFSGYFFFFKIQIFDVNVYVKQLCKKLITLGVPYLIWIVMFVLIVLVKNFIFGKLGLMEDDMYADLERSSYYDILWGGPFLFPLWYLRDLICMVVLSPIFYMLFKYTKGLGLFLLIFAYMMVWELNIPGLSTTAFFFFGAGAFMGIYKYDLMALGLRYKAWKLLAAVLFLGIATNFNATSHYEYWIRPFILTGVLVTLCIGNILVKTNKLKSHLLGLSASVFFIYAIHSIYIINWVKGGVAKSPLLVSGWGKLIGYFIIPIVCMLVCLLLYRVMKKFLPRVLDILTGERMNVRTLKNNVHGV